MFKKTVQTFLVACPLCGEDTPVSALENGLKVPCLHCRQLFRAGGGGSGETPVARLAPPTPPAVRRASFSDEEERVWRRAAATTLATIGSAGVVAWGLAADGRVLGVGVVALVVAGVSLARALAHLDAVEQVVAVSADREWRRREAIDRRETAVRRTRRTHRVPSTVA